MKNQTLSIEQMMHLKDLGVDTSKASMCWLHLNLLDEKFVLTVNDQYARYADVELIPAFTFQDIIEILPESIPIDEYDSPDDEARLFINKRVCRYTYEDYEGCPLYIGSGENGNNVLESAYNLLCWCEENGYLNKQ